LLNYTGGYHTILLNVLYVFVPRMHCYKGNNHYSHLLIPKTGKRLPLKNNYFMFILTFFDIKLKKPALRLFCVNILYGQNHNQWYCLEEKEYTVHCCQRLIQHLRSWGFWGIRYPRFRKHHSGLFTFGHSVVNTEKKKVKSKKSQKNGDRRPKSEERRQNRFEMNLQQKNRQKIKGLSCIFFVGLKFWGSCISNN